MYILNAFSASMLDLTPAPTGDKIGDFIRAACPVSVTFKVITVEQAPCHAGERLCVGGWSRRHSVAF